MALKLSRHFKDQWRVYFREEPPPASAILRLIGHANAVWLQKFQVLRTPSGQEHRQLATYWRPDKDMVIKIDWGRDKVVTVITPKSKGRKR